MKMAAIEQFVIIIYKEINYINTRRTEEHNFAKARP